jgi:serralysin
MPGITSVLPSNNPDIDGELSSLRWAVTNLTYSFPTSAGFYGDGDACSSNAEPLHNFEVLNDTQQAAVRTILAIYSSFTNFTFTEITETSAVHADLRYAMSDSLGFRSDGTPVTTAIGYYPSSAPSGGDSWYYNSSGVYDNPARGNYAFDSFMHEIGHTLGLKHGHEGPGGTLPNYGTLPAAHDSS